MFGTTSLRRIYSTGETAAHVDSGEHRHRDRGLRSAWVVAAEACLTREADVTRDQLDGVRSVTVTRDFGDLRSLLPSGRTLMQEIGDFVTNRIRRSHRAAQSATTATRSAAVEGLRQAARRRRSASPHRTSPSRAGC
jgi:hypothetical protein